MAHKKKTLKDVDRLLSFILLIYRADYEIESVPKTKFGAYHFHDLFWAYIKPFEFHLINSASEERWNVLCDFLFGINPDWNCWTELSLHKDILRQLQNIANWELSYLPKHRIRNIGLDRSADRQIIKFCRTHHIEVVQAFGRFSETSLATHGLRPHEVAKVKAIMNSFQFRLQDQPPLVAQAAVA